MLNLDQWTATYILQAFRDSIETGRKELNKKVHVMEITNAILKRNAPEANVTVSSVKKVLFKAVPGITKYTGEDNITKRYYLEGKGKLLLIGPSFESIQRAIRNISSELQIKSIFNRYDKALGKIHMDYKVNLSKSSSLASTLVGKFDFIYTVPQDSYLNRNILGAKEAKIARQFDQAVSELVDIKTSPSITEMLYEQLVAAFLGKKVKEEKFTKTKKGGLDFDKKEKITKVSIAKSTDENADLNLIRLQTLINLRLHDQIRRNMGKGRSRNVLNYRTGRFAKSAEAQAVVQNREDFIDIYYTYQRYPYDTFLPGGRLYKPGRDPRTIIGRSIRQLAVEFVGNNFKVTPVLRDKV